jgi:hypothetical protein
MHEKTRFTVVSLLAFVGLALSTEAFAQTDACAKGYVWREAFAGDHVCVAKERRDLVADENRNAQKHRKKGGGDECEPGYVWRMASPQDHVCVTQIERDQAQQDNSLATSRSAAFVAPKKPSSEIPGVGANVRTPPRKAGCFKYEKGEWKETECLSEEYIRRNFPPPAPAPQNIIKSYPQFIFPPQLEPFLYAMPIRVGSLKISHLSDPAVATVTDTLAGDDAFSIQVNTNVFPRDDGSILWVQFVLQSKPGVDDVLCVWTVNDNLAWASNYKLGFTPVCTSVPKQRNVWGPGASAWHQTTFVGIGAEINETSEVAGYVDDTQADGLTRLTAWAHVPWAPFQAFAVTIDDTISSIATAFRGRWTEMSGDVIGLGDGSQANFTRTKLRNVLEASPCIFNECPNVEQLGTLQKYAGPSVQVVTGESNNLASIYDFEDHPPVFSCAQQTCTLDYSTGPLSLKLIETRPPFVVHP